MDRYHFCKLHSATLPVFILFIIYSIFCFVLPLTLTRIGPRQGNRLNNTATVMLQLTENITYNFSLVKTKSFLSRMRQHGSVTPVSLAFS